MSITQLDRTLVMHLQIVASKCHGGFCIRPQEKNTND